MKKENENFALIFLITSASLLGLLSFLGINTEKHLLNTKTSISNNELDKYREIKIINLPYRKIKKKVSKTTVVNPPDIWRVNQSRESCKAAIYDKSKNTPENTIYLEVEVAKKKEEWIKGYSDRREFGEAEGMIFIFPEAKRRYFHMKNVFFPLDIIFIDSEGKVVKIVENAPSCFQEKCPDYDSEYEVQYVLELPGSKAEYYGIKIESLVVSEI